MLKIYTLIYDFSLCTPVEVEGKVVNIVFSGGCKAMRQNGEFSTTDKKLQEAIEKSPGFGKIYKLSKAFGSSHSEPVPAVDDRQLTEKVCRTVNEAIEWLVDLGCKKSEVNTSAKAAASAKELGYDLKFEKEKKDDAPGTDQYSEDEDR